MSVMIGRWDCRYCGHVGNLGPETKCSGCGAPRDPDVKFYLPEDAEYVSDSAEIEKAGTGADWNCMYCGSDNKAADTKCRSCGNLRSDDVTREQKEYDISAVPRSADEAEKPRDIKAPAPPKKQSKAPLIIGLALIIGILIFLFYPRAQTMTVSGHSWERSTEIENYRRVEESGWQIPPNAEMIRSFRDIHHTEKVLDHYETRTKMVRVKVGTEQYVCGKIDMGNGYFKDKLCSRDKFEERQEQYEQPIYRDQPVYQTRYVYAVNKWQRDRVGKTQGTGKNPRWPDIPPGDKWRAGNKTEKYILHLTGNKGKEYQLEVDFKIWDRYNIKDKVNVKTTIAGGVSLAGN